MDGEPEAITVHFAVVTNDSDFSKMVDVIAQGEMCPRTDRSFRGVETPFAIFEADLPRTPVALFHSDERCPDFFDAKRSHRDPKTRFPFEII